MKKFCFVLTLSSLLVITLSPYYSMAQNKRNDFYHRSKKAMVFPYENVKRYESDSIVYQDSLIRATFEFEYVYLNGVNWLMIDVENKTDNRIYIEWENVRLNKSKIKFVLDSNLKKELKKEDECILGGESSGYRFLEKDLSISSQKVEKKEIYLRKHGDTELQLSLPIRYGDKIKDYKFVFSFTKYSETEIDSLFNLYNEITNKIKYLKKGMNREEVEAIMGKSISESYMETNWGSSRAVKYYPHGVKKGDLILSYPFYNVYIRDGLMAKAAIVTKFD